MTENETVVCTSARLKLRQLTPGDASWFYRLNENPLVLKYTGDSAFKGESDARNFLESYVDYKRHGYGRWAVMRKEDSEVLGWCGLKYHPEEDYTEVGFRFFQDFWGSGYATEAALASLRLGWENFGLKVIYANVHKDNLASVKVLQRLGMIYLGKAESYDPGFLRFVTWPDRFVAGPITLEQAVQVRHPVLRPGKPLETAIFEEDRLPGVFHLGVMESGVPVATTTLLPKPWEKFSNDVCWQLRGMAVLPSYRRLSLGAAIVSLAEEEVIAKGGDVIWMNAREVAVPFYDKCGYTSVGDPFDIPGIGPHYKMFKFLERKS